MATVHEYLRSTPAGSRALSCARLRYDVLLALHDAAEHAADGGTKERGIRKIAAKLKVRPWRVRRALAGDGNLRVAAIADYLHAAGYELKVALVPLEQADADVVGSPEPHGVSHPAWSAVG